LEKRLLTRSLRFNQQQSQEQSQQQQQPVGQLQQANRNTQPKQGGRTSNPATKRKLAGKGGQQQQQQV
jgi:hypothetical protein